MPDECEKALAPTMALLGWTGTRITSLTCLLNGFNNFVFTLE